MKIIILSVLGLGVYLMFSNRPKESVVAKDPVPVEAPVAPISSAPSAPPPFVASTVPPVSISDLVVVRGSVIAKSADGLIVACKSQAHSTLEAQKFAWQVDAGTGAGEQARIAKLAMDAEGKPYGALVEMKNGRLSPAEIAPDSAADGIVLLRDHPDEKRIMEDHRFNVVAVPTGDVYRPAGSDPIRVYTMAYTLTPEAARAWMWKEKKTSLDRPRR